MDWTHYRFRTLWALPAPPGTVYDVLENAEEYPRWWRQVREVDRVDDTSGVIRIRSLLPYDMVFTARETRRDRDAGVLEIAMAGDIDGWARWTVTGQGQGQGQGHGQGAGAGALARYEQVVDVRKPLLRRLAVPGRPVFRANHALMMRSGRRGLLAHLEAV
ncbi:SRPBCC family protein [Streptomyces sp. NPDC088387]|uniref:SRPBCC family protein n=1 Tax=Streptomyces sp. NPDC088387 TaxID=3365859 RepID=UPI00380B6BAF